MIINRTDILNACSRTGANINQILKNQLAEVKEEVIVQMDENQVDKERLSVERNNLMSGGFGKSACEAVEESVDRTMAEKFFSKEKHKKNYIMHMSSEILANTENEGEVFAIGREDTARYYALAMNEYNLITEKEICNCVGLIVSNENFAKLLNKSVRINGYEFFGTYLNGEWLFYKTDTNRSFMTLLPFDLVTNLYSRNTGLLESKVMLKKKVLIAGAGSVGSFIALELARAGVGYFVLCDSDILEIHNICRHQLGWKDVGRYQVDAGKDAILNINPNAIVEVFHGYLQELPEAFVENVDMIVGTGDNREANAFGNDLAAACNVPFVNTGCWQRAHAGEVFYWAPNSSSPTYREAFSNLISEERSVSHANYFADEGDERALNFEPGVSSDIEFVTLIAVKLIYDLLNAGNGEYTPRVLDYLKNYTLVCNTNKACIGGENAEMFPSPLYISNHIILKGLDDARS